jgi:hypothetical protein
MVRHILPLLPGNPLTVRQNMPFNAFSTCLLVNLTAKPTLESSACRATRSDARFPQRAWSSIRGLVETIPGLAANRPAVAPDCSASPPVHAVARNRVLVGGLAASGAFGLWHAGNSCESPLGLLVVGAGGFVFCLSLWYTKSLWWAVGFHAGWDWGLSYLYGTSDGGLMMKGHLLASHPSGNPLWGGGAAGPEGSLLILPLLIMTATGIWIWWVFSHLDHGGLSGKQLHKSFHFLAALTAPCCLLLGGCSAS